MNASKLLVVIVCVVAVLGAGSVMTAAEKVNAAMSVKAEQLKQLESY